MNLPYSSAGWSDALIHVPMVLYRFYGDKEILEMVYEAAYRKEFLRGGRAHGKRQCCYVRPVSMGLAKGKAGKKIAKQLNHMCVKNQYKIGTGFLSTWQVLNVLSDYGYVDTAYRMLTQTACPGWMYEIEKGATTIWENWMGVDENGVPQDSHNHYAMGRWPHGYSLELAV